LTEVEREAVLTTAKEHKYGPYVLVMLYCGVRRGECVALTRGDVNLDDRFITVDKAYSYSTSSKGILTGTKAENMRKNRIDTEEGELYAREIPIVDLLAPVLDDVCEGKEPEELLFPKEDGKNAAKGSLAWWWKSFVRQCHINAGAKIYRSAIVYESSPFAKEVTPHYLRHTFATDMRAAGIEEKDRDYFMGHNSGDIGSVYAAMSDAVRIRALKKLNELHSKQEQNSEDNK
jgi:integrase